MFVMLAGGTWWFWPRGDDRFVGKWVAYANATTTQQGGIFDFRRNGTGWFDWGGVAYWTVWDTEDGNLHFGLRFAESRLAGSIKSITGPMMWMTTMSYEIERMENDTIRLHGGPSFQPTLILRRLHE